MEIDNRAAQDEAAWRAYYQKGKGNLSSKPPEPSVPPAAQFTSRPPASQTTGQGGNANSVVIPVTLLGEVRETLTRARAALIGLADQQAMADDSWIPSKRAIDALLAKLPREEAPK